MNNREYNRESWEEIKEQRARKAKDHRNRMSRLFSKETAESVKNTKIYGVDAKFNENTNSNDKETIIEIIDTDTVSAASIYKDKEKVALLNFASYKHPGGGFLKGSMAQEESLCHESNLYSVLACFSNTYYAWNYKNLNRVMYRNRALYTPNVVFRDKEFTCDVITCASPNRKASQRYNFTTEGENSEALRERIKFILDIAREEGVQTLILGAFGCGAFGQNPTEVSKIFKEYLETTHKCFERVVFAIPDGKNNNLKEFKNTFKM